MSSSSLTVVAFAAVLAAAAAGCSANVTVGNCSEGDTFPAEDGCNTCTCGPDGQASCTELDCAGGCVYAGAVHQVGESFDAGDGCNSCTCSAPGQVECSNLACGCTGGPPPCPGSGDPSCQSVAQCDGTSWTCVLQCDCDGAPPIDCTAPPEGCYWDGPVCIDGQWSCGDLVCDPCAGPQPDCPPPPDPSCTTAAVCTDSGWICETNCQTSTCEEMYPDGYAMVLGLVYQSCGCAPGSPCEPDCGDSQSCGGNQTSDACNFCIQDQVDMGASSSCVTNAALGPECQNDAQCSAYVQCVINGG